MGDVSAAALAARQAVVSGGAVSGHKRPMSASDKALQEIEEDEGVVYIPDDEDGYTAGGSQLASPAKSAGRVHGDGEGKDGEEEAAMAGGAAQQVSAGSVHDGPDGETSSTRPAQPLQRTATAIVREQIGFTSEEAAAMAMEAERAANEQRQRAF